MRDPESREAAPLPDPGSWSVLSTAKGREDRLRAFHPRRKLISHGAGVLGHAELLEVVLGAGARREPAHRIAERLLRRHGLPGLARLSFPAWVAEPGVGPAGAARLSAAFELGRRAHGSAETLDRPRLNGPDQASRQVRGLGSARREHLVGLYLDAQNGLIHRETISTGSLNTTRSHPREILFPAVAHLALGFILAHNHPSGCPEPSTEDLEFTRAVQRAGEVMGIELYDHLIVTRNGYTSLRERGLM